jgi:hypothetical protein
LVIHEVYGDWVCQHDSTETALTLYAAIGREQGEGSIFCLASLGMVIAEDWGELDI